MGRRAEMKMPRYVHGYIDRHGKPWFYFRRRGFKDVPLSGLPWSPEFMAKCEAAIAGQPIEIGARRVKPAQTNDPLMLGRVLADTTPS